MKTTTNAPFFEALLDDQYLVRIVSKAYFDEFFYHQSSLIQKIEGVFYQFQQYKEAKQTILYIFNKKRSNFNEIHRDNAWYRRKELAVILNQLDCNEKATVTRIANTTGRKRLIFDLLLKLYILSLGEELGLEKGDIIDLLERNTQNRIVNQVVLYSQGEKYNAKRYSKLGVNDEQYSHIRHFAWIYWNQIKSLVNILETIEEEITVVDLGAGNCHFILATAKFFQKKGLLNRLKFIAIDNNPQRLNKQAKPMLQEINGLKFEFITTDIAAPNFTHTLLRQKAQLIVCNHLLEHLPEEIKNHYLHNWLLAAEHTLSISVPLNDPTESSISEHFHAFTVEDIHNIADSMEIRVGYAIKAKNIDQTKFIGLWNFEKVIQREAETIKFHPTASLTPKTIEVNPSPIYADFQKPFNLDEFKKIRRAPLIGKIQDTATFARQGGRPRQCRQIPIKFPDTTVEIPAEFAQFKEAIQIIINHNLAINPNYANYYAYLNMFRGMTKFDAYRGLSLNCHGDQLQTLNSNHWYNPDYSYIISSTLPTTFYEQGFDLSQAMIDYKAGRPVNLYRHMNRQAKEEHIYHSENFGIYLLSPYIVHAASLAHEETFRVFMKVAFSSKRFFDNRELRRNPAFNYEDWYQQETLGYIDGWLQHAHYNERFLKEDILL